eukprot:3701098-Pleurochrysis_carterae.AAC.1
MPYVADAESAYKFCPVQRADLWTQCFIWWDAEGKAGAVVDRRMGFGGAFAPNLFERVSTLVVAWVQGKQRAFDAQQQYPPAVQRSAEKRAQRQRNGGIPGDPEQLAPRYLQVLYIDDFTGSALTDEVKPPTEVEHVAIDPMHTTAGGGTLTPTTTRAHVHAQLAVLGLAELGLHAAPAKVGAGDPALALGFSVGAASGALRVPSNKRTLIVAAAAEMREEAIEPARVHWRKAWSFVGRLSNLAQVLPELKTALRGGYAVAQPARGGQAGGWRRGDDWGALEPGGRAAREWVELLGVATELVGANEGVQLAPREASLSMYT